MADPANRHAFVKPPRAARQPKVETWHGVELVDDYAWLKADNWQEVMREPSVLAPDIRAYLDAENAYCEEQLSETVPLQEGLYREMRARLKEDDSSVPAPDGPYAYSTGFVAGGQYPVVRRQARDGGDEVVLLEPVLVREATHLRGKQRQHRLDRVEAEVAALGDPDAARLRHLEPVADLHPADRTALDPLDRHADVEQLHLGHRCTASVVKPSATAGTSPSLRTVCACEEGHTAHSDVASA